MSVIGDTIKGIIETQGLIYFRSVNINDLNRQVGSTDLSPGVGVYANLPEVEALTYPSTNRIVENTTIEVYYLALNGTTDDPGDKIEIILDTLEPLVLEFIDKLMDSGLVAKSYTVEGYTRDALETLKLTREILTGWRVEIVLPIDRQVYYGC